MSRARSPDFKREFGQRLHAVRIALGYKTGKEFADYIGIDQNRYSMWERGERLPEPEILGKIKLKTSVTIDYLYYGDMSGLPYSMVSKIQVLAS